MVISNLNYVEVVSEKNTVEGGLAFADSVALADAVGNGFAFTNTFTNSDAISFIGLKAASSTAVSFSKADV